jgi:hypothetical protein
MTTSDYTGTHLEIRLVLLSINKVTIAAMRHNDGFKLPRISIPSCTRPAEQLQFGAQKLWYTIICTIDFLPQDDCASPCAIAEILSDGFDSDLVRIQLGDLDQDELSRKEKIALQELLIGHIGSRGPLSHVGWLREATDWVRSAIPANHELAGDFRQLNATGHFSLIRFSASRGPAYWLKATGAPNRHEFQLTERLAQICPDCLPPRIAGRSEWNAWISEEAGAPCCEWTPQKLEQATRTLASIQLKALAQSDELLFAGGLDLRITNVRRQVDAIFGYLTEAMLRQTSTRSLRIDVSRLATIKDLLALACARMEDLGIPNSVVHHDLNKGNILFEDTRCVLTDWCEAGVGNPILCCHALWSNKEAAATEWLPQLHAIAEQCWIEVLSKKQINTALALAPLLTLLMNLYGRGTWLQSPEPIHPSVESYKRTLARRMDQACRNPKLLEAL